MSYLWIGSTICFYSKKRVLERESAMAEEWGWQGMVNSEMYLGESWSEKENRK